MLAVPLTRRPLLPGILMPVRVRSDRLVAELEEMKLRGQTYVGCFYVKDAAALAAAEGRSAEEEEEEEETEVDEAEELGLGPSAKPPPSEPLGGAAQPGTPVAPEVVELVGEAAAEHLHEYGTFAQVHGIHKFESGGATLMLMGHRRLRRVGVARAGPLCVRVQHLKDAPYDKEGDVVKATANEVVSTIKELLRHNPMHKEQLSYFAQHVSDFQNAAKLADLGASLCSGNEQGLQAQLEVLDVGERLQATLVMLKKELELSKLQADIGKRVEEKISADQRKYFLNEQLKSIKKELGLEKDDKSALLARFEERLAPVRASLPPEAARVITEEMGKLRGLEPSSSEFNVTRTYLEWLTALPWGVHSEEKLDVAAASAVLDADHFGLDDVKERLLEFIAVARLKGSTQGKILCLAGPPGVGKTSVGRSVASALGRKFFRFSVGGLSDVAEIKGHRRTYVGAMPGKLVQCLKATGVANPLVLIDEIDKLGRGHTGDTASALLELLDPEQNGSFVDHYLDVPVDLSKVLFICTANVLDTIPGPLLDRMEIIRLSGYISDEKVAIARRYLEPAARAGSGVGERAVTLTDAAVASLVEDYCREAGVRNLQKHLEKIYRKVALRVVRRNEAAAAPGTAAAAEAEPLVIDAAQLSEYVGPAPFPTDKLYEEPPVGVVTGLAWTAMGGSTLYVETSVAERGAGKGALKCTGQLGEVMKESADIAHTFARGYLGRLRPGDPFFEEARIHVHVPAGATPKDGPSAGATLVTALLSLALGVPAQPHLAMTGEVTLTGRILPVGGIKEKTIAARRSGVRTLILPSANRRDYEEVPAEVRKGLEVHFVDCFEEVAQVAFGAEKLSFSSEPAAAGKR